MRISTDMIGKKVIRTDRNKHSDGSFSNSPEVITNITSDHFYLEHGIGSQPYLIKRVDWDDDKWIVYEPYAKNKKCICRPCPKCGGTL